MILGKKEFFKWVIILACLALVTACTQRGKIIDSKVKYNSKESQEQPYLILISLDGFRWDYVERFKPPHLSKFIEQGVAADSLIPTFPSKTFPNHYAIATGMYPDKNKILGNSFYDYASQSTYSIDDRETVEDGSYYGGSPIWVHAANNGMVSASYYFIGSEAKIGGARPSFYYNYDGRIKNIDRVNQTLDWLALPAKKRPHLITMYFSDMDDTGHKVGPNDDDKLKENLYKLDSVLGELFKGVKASKLPVNIVFVSDHGMMEVPIGNFIPFEVFEKQDSYTAINNGSLINIHPRNPDKIESVFDGLKANEKNNNYKVYKTENTPGFEYIPQNKNWGPIQIVVNKGYYFMSQESIDRRKAFDQLVFGQHGFDPINKEMHGIFYAKGPDFKKGHTTPSIKNIHIYPLMCKILGLDIPKDIDGRLDQLESVLIN